MLTLYFMSSTNTFFKKKIFNQTKELYQLQIFGVIGNYWSGGTVEQVAEELATIPENATIKVVLDSVGGDVQNGTSIAILLRNAKQRVEVNIIGWAASIASVIALAGDRVTMSPGAFFMIHKPSTMIWQQVESEELRNTANFLDQIESSLIDLYVKAIELRGKNIERSQVEEWVKNETWFSPEEAIEAGFVDAIEGEDRKVEEGQQTSDTNNFSNKFFNKAPKRETIQKMTKEKKAPSGFFAALKALFTNQEAVANIEAAEAAIEAEEATETLSAEEIEARKAELEALGFKVVEAEAVVETPEAVVEEVAPVETAAQIEARVRAQLEKDMSKQIANQLAQIQAGTATGSENVAVAPVEKEKTSGFKTIKEAASFAAKVAVERHKNDYERFTKALLRK